MIIRLGALGDVVRTLPALRQIRRHYPRARISWLVESKGAAVVRTEPAVDEVIVFPRWEWVALMRRGRMLAVLGRAARFVRELRGRRFDLALDFHAILKSGLLSALSGAPVRVSYARPWGREGVWWLANRRVTLTTRRCSRFDRNAGLVRFLGIEADGGAYRLPIEPALRDHFERALAPQAAPLVIHPGSSSGTPYKRYTAEGYAAVARALAESEGLPCIVTSGPMREERAVAEAVVAAAGGAALHAPSTPTFAHLAALLSCCRVFVGSDSGPLHVASLVGTPVVQILGPTHPIENEPYRLTPYRVVRVPVSCSPCRRGCASATCMRLVRPRSIVEAARQLLAVSPGDGRIMGRAEVAAPPSSALGSRLGTAPSCLRTGPS